MLVAQDTEWLGEMLGRHGALSDADIMTLDGLKMTQRRYEAGQYLLREGDKIKVCSFLVSGFIYRQKIVGNGGRQIVSIHIPYDFVDVQNILLDHADHSIQALTEAQILSVSRDELFAIAATHPAICKALWQGSLIEAATMREWIANIGRRDARARTAHLLCEMAVRREAAGLGQRDTFDLPMTQEQIGDALGLTAVHVNRTLKTLESDGAITRNKRSVTVASWRSLQQIGDFTSAYLHLAENG